MIDVEADHEKCMGYANCITAAPDVFDIDDDGAVIVLRGSVENGERDRVSESVRSCPASALRLTERHAG